MSRPPAVGNPQRRRSTTPRAAWDGRASEQVRDGRAVEHVERLLASLVGRRRGALRRGSHRARALCEELGSPHLRVPVIHVAGTNGKTSVVRMIASLLAALDVPAGDTTSPHLHQLGERIRIDTETAGPAELAAALQRLPLALERAERRTGEPPTFFDAITGLALATFADTDRELAVVEAGIGGTGDATDVVQGRVAVLTPIGLDHVELGTRLAEVAANKAGIIRPGGVVVTAAQHREADEAVERAAAGQGATVVRIGVDARVLSRRCIAGGQVIEVAGLGGHRFHATLPLHGVAQAANAALALATVQAALGTSDLDPEKVRLGLAAVRVPGRVEIVERTDRPTVVLDGAHDPRSSAALAATLHERFGAGPVAVVIGTSGGRHPRPLLAPLAAQLGERLRAVVATRASAPGASPADAVAARLASRWPACVAAGSVREACERASNAVGQAGTVVVTGSLYLAAEARALVVPVDEPLVVADRLAGVRSDRSAGTTAPGTVSV